MISTVYLQFSTEHSLYFGLSTSLFYFIVRVFIPYSGIAFILSFLLLQSFKIFV